MVLIDRVLEKGSSVKYLNISEIAFVFELSRPTVRKRLKKAKVNPEKRVKGAKRENLYDLAKVGPALFDIR